MNERTFGSFLYSYLKLNERGDFPATDKEMKAGRMEYEGSRTNGE